MYGSLLHHIWEAMTSLSNVDIQIIAFVNACNIEVEGTIDVSLYLCTTMFCFSCLWTYQSIMHFIIDYKWE